MCTVLSTPGLRFPPVVPFPCMRLTAPNVRSGLMFPETRRATMLLCAETALVIGPFLPTKLRVPPSYMLALREQLDICIILSNPPGRMLSTTRCINPALYLGTLKALMVSLTRLGAMLREDALRKTCTAVLLFIGTPPGLKPGLILLRRHPLSTPRITGLLRFRTLSPIRWLPTSRQLQRAATAALLPLLVGWPTGATQRTLTPCGIITTLLGRRFAACPTLVKFLISVVIRVGRIRRPPVLQHPSTKFTVAPPVTAVTALVW